MRLISPTTDINEADWKTSRLKLKAIELAGRTCYKSEGKITETSYKGFIKKLISMGHESVLEHEKVTIRFVIDRGVSHELVRHRICSFSQESTRYCDYGETGVKFIIPPWVDLEEGTYDVNDLGAGTVKGALINEATLVWVHAMLNAEFAYNSLRLKGWSPQQARAVLPNSLKTEIVVTANFREWRTIFKQRTANAAHPQMREVMVPLLEEMRNLFEPIFDDILIQ